MTNRRPCASGGSECRAAACADACDEDGEDSAQLLSPVDVVAGLVRQDERRYIQARLIKA
ncbi:MAG: hypothetical protein AAF918_19725 [Pseudomonadota bacterium]